MQLKSLSIFSLFLLLFGSSLLGSCQTDEEKSTLVKVGQQAPNFVFSDATGQEKSSADLKGQVVMINFFATWCGPCLKELPHVQSDIFEQHKDHPDFTLMVIGREHTAEELAKFKKEKGYSFDLMADPNRKIYSKFAEQFIPRNFLIDRNGTIIYSSVGFKEDEFNKLKNILEAQLEK